jgi:hypothetical protein
MQAVVENIVRRDPRLALDSIAGVACPVLAMKAEAASRLNDIALNPAAGVEFICVCAVSVGNSPGVLI